MEENINYMQRHYFEVMVIKYHYIMIVVSNRCFIFLNSMFEITLNKIPTNSATHLRCLRYYW